MIRNLVTTEIMTFKLIKKYHQIESWCHMTNTSFQNKLAAYANLAIKLGLQIQSGDWLHLTINLDQANLAHLLVEAAYQAGARKVMVQWQDDQLQRLDLTYQSAADLQTSLPYQEEQLQFIATNHVKRLVVVSTDPAALQGIPTEKIAAYQQRQSKGLAAVRNATQNNQLSWLIIAAASPAWAQKVFPQLTAEAATEELWQAIFKANRVDQPDPIAAWQQHRDDLSARAARLNQYQFDALHYQAPGTDLTIGLPKNHIWEAAGATNTQGECFIPNMPTEEVFTAPDWLRVDGTVSSTKPLSYAGTVLSGLQLTFKNGQVIAATAKQGQATLEQLLATDEGARHLGEVALVPDQSPISQSGLIFYNTLFDENASDHLALGAAYPFSVKNGTKLNKLQLQKAGLNVSQVHVDFMVGSAEMNIDGLTKTGEVVPLFRKGNWAK